MNTFINLIKKFLVERGIRGGIRASEGVRTLLRASLLPTLDPFAGFWALPSLFCSSTGLFGGLTEGLRQVQDPRAIAIELKSKKCDFSKRAG